eukprot:766894-Hanusia_phi.AAC.6
MHDWLHKDEDGKQNVGWKLVAGASGDNPRSPSLLTLPSTSLLSLSWRVFTFISAATVAHIVTYPMDTIRRRMQLQVSPPPPLLHFLPFHLPFLHSLLPPPFCPLPLSYFFFSSVSLPLIPWKQTFIQFVLGAAGVQAIYKNALDCAVQMVKREVLLLLLIIIITTTTTTSSSSSSATTTLQSAHELEQGVRSLYRGLTATCIRGVPNTGEEVIEEDRDSRGGEEGMKEEEEEGGRREEEEEDTEVNVQVLNIV